MSKQGGTSDDIVGAGPGNILHEPVAAPFPEINPVTVLDCRIEINIMNMHVLAAVFLRYRPTGCFVEGKTTDLIIAAVGEKYRHRPPSVKITEPWNRFPAVYRMRGHERDIGAFNERRANTAPDNLYIAVMAQFASQTVRVRRINSYPFIPYYGVKYAIGQLKLTVVQK